MRLGLISITSPIARALVGKSEGDVVDVAVPGGSRAFEIVAIRYGWSTQTGAAGWPVFSALRR